MSENIRNIVIAGLGSVSPAGRHSRAAYTALEVGRGCISELLPGLSLSPSQIGAAARDATTDDRPRIHQLAEAAVREALKESSLEIVARRIGLVLGTAISATVEMEATLARGRTLQPSDFRFGTVTEQIAESLGLGGPCYTVATGCAAGLDAVGVAFDQIATGDADAMVAVGSDATLCPIVFAAFSQIHALSKTNDANLASIPFGTDRSGFVLGEGAGAIVLAALDAVPCRQEGLVEVLGWSSVSNAFHMTAMRTDGSDLARLLRELLDRTALRPTDIDLVDVHGTSTKMNDEAEAMAIAEVFGEHSRALQVTAQKTLFGHALGAANALELVNLCRFLQAEMVPSWNVPYRLESFIRFKLSRTSSAPVRRAIKLASSFSGIHSGIVLASRGTA